MMKFKAAIAVSVAFHISLFAIALVSPGSGKSSGTTYYVDLISLPGGGGKGGGNQKISSAQTSQIQSAPARMKDLTTQKQEDTSTLRYPDAKPQKKKKETRKKESLISIQRKDKDNNQQKDPLVKVTRNQSGAAGTLTTGISAGDGGGSGGGSGTGTGDGFGDGMGTGDFPYAYYIATLRNKISSSWYNALISPGVRGKFAAVVFFKILRGGSVEDIKLETESGLKSLDLSAVRAIENASPFPPLPSDYPYSYLGVHFEFVWET